MARAPQQTQRQAPQPLESPAVRRSRILSDMLEQSRQAPPQIQSGGELAARLLAQGLNQFSVNRADRAVQEERDALTAQQRDALTRALGGGASAPSPLGNALAPEPAPMSPQIAPVEGSALPPAAPPQAPAPQSSIPGPLRAQIQLLMDQGDIAGATELFGQYQQQEAIRSTLPPELQNNPMAAFAATQNPQAFAESLGYQFRPQVVAEGGLQSVVGMNQQVRNPRTREFGMNLVRDTPEGVETIATREPTPQEQAALINANRPVAVTTATGADTRLVGLNGEVVSEFSGREAPSTNQATTPAVLEIQGRLDSTRREVLPTTGRMRSLLQSGDVITGFGATARLDAARALAAFGNQDAQRQVAATQEYQNLSGQLRVGLAKSLGANPSNADIILLERVTAGDIGQDPGALLATIGQAEGRANALIEDLTRQVPTQGRGPQPGQVEDGYQYIGGDPASPSSWRRVQ
jgi:hypothetical protein